MSEDVDSVDDVGEDIVTTLSVIDQAFLFKIPPKPSSQGHSAEQWPKQALWVGRLKILQTNTQCILQFEHTDKKDGIYLRVPINNHESGGDLNAPQTIETVIDSSRYFALTILKPNTKDQYFELGLGFETRDDSVEFKSAIKEFERIQHSISKGKEELSKFVHQDFSLQENEVLDIKPFNKTKNQNKNQNQNQNTSNDKSNDSDLLSFMPPPSSSKTDKKSKKKAQNTNDDTSKNDDNNTNKTNNNDNNFTDADFGDFTSSQNDTTSNKTNKDDTDDWASFN